MNSLGKLMMMLNADKTEMVTAESALPGRSEPDFQVPETHAVLGTPLKPPFPEGIETAYFALGCFWGAEQLFWKIDGVYTTRTGSRRTRPTRRPRPARPATPRR
jgi:peptide-methionine (S)-S-oxide reductase